MGIFDWLLGHGDEEEGWTGGWTGEQPPPIPSEAGAWPDLDEGRYWRYGVGVPVEVDVRPPQRSKLLGPSTGQQGHDDVVVQVISSCPSQDVVSLLCCQCLGRPSSPASRHLG